MKGLRSSLLYYKDLIRRMPKGSPRRYANLLKAVPEEHRQTVIDLLAWRLQADKLQALATQQSDALYEAASELAALRSKTL